MSAIALKYPPALASGNSHRCLSCGTTERMVRRRYCSMACRQKLRETLNRRTGLLKALNTRYATFYFTDLLIILDILPHGDDQIHSYILARSQGRKPFADFSVMAEMLGKVWWAERRRTRKRYLASRHVLDKARKPAAPSSRVIPMEMNIPAVKGAALIFLKLDESALNLATAEERIKSAYRLQAKKHHPDLGGDSAMFRKIQQAYENLLQWAKNPIFVRRSGFPDKWFYDGTANRWVQPTPHPKPKP
jgi:ribosomal protein S14